MKISTHGIELLKQWEGSKTKPYKDSAGLWTVGVGHLVQKGEDFSAGLTNEQVIELLSKDLTRFEDVVNTKVTVPLNQNQFDALVSFTFNTGTGAFSSSTLLKKLNAGDYDAVPEQLLRWTKAGGKPCDGLVNRRNKEIKLWRGLI